MPSSARNASAGRGRRVRPRGASRGRGRGTCRHAVPRSRARAAARVRAGRRARGRTGTTRCAPGTTRSAEPVRAVASRVALGGEAARPGVRLGERAGGCTHASAATSAGVETDHSGWASAQLRRPAAGLGEQVADAQPGQAPGLGQAADDHQARAGRAAGEALGSPGTQSMNASSTTSVTRPGRASAATARPGAAPRSGWSGCRSRPGRRRRAPRRVEDGTSPSSTTRSTGWPAAQQRGLGLGELRVHDDRASRAQHAGEQHERLGGAGRQQHLVVGPAVPAGDRLARAAPGRGRRPRLAHAVTEQRRPATAGGVPGRTFTARSTRPGPTSASPWWHRPGPMSRSVPSSVAVDVGRVVRMVVGVLRGADPVLEAGHRDPVEAGVAVHPDVADAAPPRTARAPGRPAPSQSPMTSAQRTSSSGCAARTGRPAATMRSGSTPANRKYGSTTMRSAPRRRQRSSAAGTPGSASDDERRLDAREPRPSHSSRATLATSALASGSVDPRPTSTTVGAGALGAGRARRRGAPRAAAAGSGAGRADGRRRRSGRGGAAARGPARPGCRPCACRRRPAPAARRRARRCPAATSSATASVQRRRRQLDEAAGDVDGQRGRARSDPVDELAELRRRPAASRVPWPTISSGGVMVVPRVSRRSVQQRVDCGGGDGRAALLADVADRGQAAARAAPPWTRRRRRSRPAGR